MTSGRFVLDCSITLSWCFEEEESPFARKVLDLLENSEAIVPPIWCLEVVNMLAVAERRKRISEAESARFLLLLQMLPVRVAEGIPLASPAELAALARRTGLSAYDASYLDLAMRLGVPLVTLDARLREKAAELGVPAVDRLSEPDGSPLAGRS